MLLMKVGEDVYSPESGNMRLPANGNRPMRSPGPRMPASTPPILEDVVSPFNESGPLPGSRAAPPTGGVKRTKSLMQKIKTMVRTRSGSVEGQPNMPQVHAGQGYGQGYRKPGLAAGQRSKSMSTMAGYVQPVIPLGSPGWADRDVVEEELEDEPTTERSRAPGYTEPKPRSQSVYAATRR